MRCSRTNPSSSGSPPAARTGRSTCRPTGSRYKGRFDQGWDRLREENFARQKKLGVIPASAELTPRPPELPAWDSLTADEKTLLAREAEVSAAYLAYTDAQVGRVLDEIRAQVRSVFSHVTDIAPTIYELTGVALPDSYEGIRQVPLEGQSLAATFDPPRGSTAHTRQYFEIGGTRGIYQDGWWAGTRNARNQPGSVWNSEPTGYRPWELYHLDEDYSQAHELAARTASRPISWCPSAAATA
jgi:arylsulfatase A-like enzyme